jgi:hypothetical protein
MINGYFCSITMNNSRGFDKCQQGKLWKTTERLQQIAAWMNKNSKAVYGTKGSPFKPFRWGRCTQKQKKDGTILYFFGVRLAIEWKSFIAK